MKRTNYYIFQGSAELVKYWQEPEKWSKHRWYWTARKEAMPGDKAFIYLTAPLSRIVGEVDIISKPFFNTLPYAFETQVMREKWCCEVGNPTPFNLYTEDLTIAFLRKCFSIDWGWVRYPRGNTRVPTEIVPMLLQLAGRKPETCRRSDCVHGFIPDRRDSARPRICPECGGN